MKPENKTAKKEILRVALDPQATHAFEVMAKELKGLSEHVKFHPSEFVSLIVSDYLNFYFKLNRDHLIAAFFDSHGFVTAQTSKTKGKDNFMEVMQQALEESKRIKGKLHKMHKSKNQPEKVSKTNLGDDTTP